LKELQQYYEDQGNATKLAWANFERLGFDRTQQFQYILDAEVPSADLRPVDSIPEADELYNQAMKLMLKGGRYIPILYREQHMIQALKSLKTLIRLYPTSDKIDDAAYYCGEIHKEYLKGQELIAVRWYERAIQWDPQTPHPARFQAAVVCDYRLHDRARALEFYHGVLEHESNLHITNTRFASRRIYELSSPPSSNERTQVNSDVPDETTQQSNPLPTTGPSGS